LQYAAVRIKSILRKAQELKFACGTPCIHSAQERALVLQLLSLGEAMRATEDKRAPNILCDYAFTLAQNFSRFYTAHHILSETDGRLLAQRLGLCAKVLEVMTQTLALLGIAVPERM
jgi:arginyl-tRNA synthetase